MVIQDIFINFAFSIHPAESPKRVISGRVQTFKKQGVYLTLVFSNRKLRNFTKIAKDEMATQMPTVGIFMILPWVAVYICLMHNGYVCIWLPMYGTILYIMRGLSAVVRFLRFWAMRRPTVCETGEGKEPTHSVYKSIKANVGLIYLILGFCRKHNE